MNKFWIILALSSEVTQSLKYQRYDTLETASAAARDLAASRPTVEGYAIMECMLVTQAPIITVDLKEPNSTLPVVPVEAPSNPLPVIGIAAADTELSQS